MIAEVQTETIEATATRHTVRLAFPGHSFSWGAVAGVMEAARNHDFTVANSGNGWDDFNRLWVDSLNAAERGEVTHFAMLHSDIAPDPCWLDVLLSEMDATGADLVSAVAPIKDNRGVTSSGIGDPSDRWSPLRRFTMREVCGMPETFSIADTPYPDKFLLHNTGCWVCDLRNPLFRATDPDGTLRCYFDFPRRCYRGDDGVYRQQCESEDWYFSRKIAELGAKTYITRKVRLLHRGTAEYPNYAPWGTREHDEDLAAKWRTTTTTDHR